MEILEPITWHWIELSLESLQRILVKKDSLLNIPDVDRMTDILLENPKIALYDNYYGIKSKEEYQSCKIVVTPSKYDVQYFSYAFQKNSPYLSLFDKYLGELREKGTARQILSKYDPGDQICPDYSGLPIGFDSCFTAFLALISGSAAGLILFFIEYLSHEILGLKISILDLYNYDKKRYNKINENIKFCENCKYCESCNRIMDGIWEF